MAKWPRERMREGPPLTCKGLCGFFFIRPNLSYYLFEVFLLNVDGMIMLIRAYLWGFWTEVDSECHLHWS